MPDAFLLTVPVAEPFRTLASDVAARYAELAGGSAVDGGALSAAVAGAVASVTDGAARDADIALAFRPQRDGIEIQVRCGGRQTTVRRTLIMAADRRAD
jgi:hypothetical protein